MGYVNITKKTTGKPAEAKKRGRGRPPEKEGQPKRSPLNMRTTREIREQLESAAKKSGRSLTQEVEYRLEQPIQQEQRVKDIRETVCLDIVEHAFGGQEIYDVLQLLASELEILKKTTGKTLADPANYSQIRQLVDNAFKKLTSTT